MLWSCSANLRKVSVACKMKDQGSVGVFAWQRQINQSDSAESGVSLEPEPPLPRQRMMDVPVQNKSVLQRLFRRREPPVAGAPALNCPFLSIFLLVLVGIVLLLCIA